MHDAAGIFRLVRTPGTGVASTQGPDNAVHSQSVIDGVHAYRARFDIRVHSYMHMHVNATSMEAIVHVTTRTGRARPLELPAYMGAGDLLSE